MQPEPSPRPLTPDDIVNTVNELLAHGWGQVRIVIAEHYIKIVEPTKTILGSKP